ncbi:hypothetical protein PBY51_024167 [Eleginops maclovinus]|uniref:UPAR/Ly6 domain-containing protein n=1 Tax=Eleginops maclovinus TaxID=56733 RepID=A0AAN7XY46_ELEMC|nr:hypothetical protein PBY51_024167 [Eleginops maclovinus]
MMKLIPSLTVFWMLSITGTKTQTSSCVSSSICESKNQTFSFNFGDKVLHASVQCCDTCNCKTADVTAWRLNNLTCFICDDGTVCNNKTVQCMGNQNRCFKGTVSDGKSSKKYHGCASENMCKSASDLGFLTGLKFLSGPFCCATNQCNSAWTVKLSVVPFWLGLLVSVAH